MLGRNFVVNEISLTNSSDRQAENRLTEAIFARIVPTVPRLEKVTNLVTIVTCVALLATLGYRTFYQPGPQIRRAVAPFPAGRTMEPIEGLRYSSQGGRAVLIFVSSHCRFCSESMPFYRHLADQGVHIVVVGTESVETLQAYAKDNALSSEVVSVKSMAPVEATPTLAILADDRTVLFSWRGKLPEKQEREAIKIPGVKDRASVP
ncbi:hypothetical protein BH18ACI5_BH18ACI5_11990 [soil metagenome]